MNLFNKFSWDIGKACLNACVLFWLTHFRCKKFCYESDAFRTNLIFVVFKSLFGLRHRKNGITLGYWYLDMAGSASKQDDKMKRFLFSDWLPERERWASQKRNPLQFDVTFWPYNKSYIDRACSLKMIEYWPLFLCCCCCCCCFFFFVFFFCFFCCFFFVDLNFVAVHKNAKRNLSNIHPS